MWPDECTLKPSAGSGKSCLVFAIYYRKPKDDMAFQRAAKTWCDEMLEDFPGAKVRIRLARAHSVKDFLIEWAKIHAIADAGKTEILAGNLLTHADKFGTTPGLEFGRDGGDPDSTLDDVDIAKLPRLPWTKFGLLVLSGCGTGLPMRGAKESMARRFAQTQRVNTVGQRGFASFSRRWGHYGETSASTEKMYLWAYRGKKNVEQLPLPHTTIPTGGRIPGEFVTVHV